MKLTKKDAQVLVKTLDYFKCYIVNEDNIYSTAQIIMPVLSIIEKRLTKKELEDIKFTKYFEKAGTGYSIETDENYYLKNKGPFTLTTANDFVKHFKSVVRSTINLYLAQVNKKIEFAVNKAYTNKDDEFAELERDIALILRKK